MSWPTRKLGDLVAFRNGVSYSRASQGGDLPIIGVGDVSPGGDLPSSGYETIAMPVGLSEEAIVQKGDLVFVRSSGSKHLVGRCARVGEMEVPTSHSGFTIRARVVASDVNPNWVAAFFQNGLADAALGRGARGTNINNLRQEKLAGIDLPCPPRDLQDRMIELIRSAKEACARVGAAVAARAKFRRGLMQELLTGRRRFPEFGTGCVSDPGIAPRGRDWVVTELSQLVTNVTRRNGAAVHRVLTVSGAQGLVDQRDFFTKSVAGKSTEGYFLLRKGEFAYNRSRMKGYRFGAIKRLDAFDAGALSTLNICFSLTDSRVHSDFLLQYFESGLLDRQLRRIAQEGARAHGLLNVTKADFFRLRVPLPSLLEQSAIVSILNALDTEIALLRTLAARLREQKRGLTQRLFSGELDLSKLIDRQVESAT